MKPFGLIYSAMTPDDRMYVGQTVTSLSIRRNSHNSKARDVSIGNGLKGEIRRFGRDSIRWGVIMDNIPFPVLDVLEEWFIITKDSYYHGLNKTPYAVGTYPRCEKLSEERKLHLSEINCGERNPFFGKSHSDHVKRKIGEASKNHWANPEYRQKISSAISRLKKKPVIVDGVKYESVAEACKLIGICTSTFDNWKSSKKHTIVYQDNITQE